MKQFFLLGSIFFLVNCASNRAVELYPLKREKAPIADRYVFMIVLDGPRVEDMEQLVHEGKLPTIRSTFFEKGARFKDSTSVFPASSAPGHQAIMTGVFPGRNGVPALSWLDRSGKNVVEYLSSSGLKRLNSTLFNFRRLFNPTTSFSDTPHILYTALSGHPTFNSFEQASFGATRFQPKFLLPFGWEYAMSHNYEYTDIKAAEKTIKTLSKTKIEKFPRLTVTAFYTLDMLLHEEEPLSDRVVDTYRHIDVYLRELQKLLEKKKILEKSVFILTGDHGFHVTGKKALSLKKLLALEGMNAEEAALFDDADAIVTGRAISANTLYLKADKKWEQPAFLEDWEAIPSQRKAGSNIVETLLDHPGIEWILGKRKDGSVEARSKKGRALIWHTSVNGEDFYRYEIPAGSSNPFEPASLSLNKTRLSVVERQKSGTLFKGNGHPDVLVLASSLFDDGRAEGIYTALNPAWNIRRIKLGNHGSIDREDIRVPLWFSGDGIKPGEYGYGRTVDIYPTVAALFDLAIDTWDTDGRVLTEILLEPSVVGKESATEEALAKIELDFIRTGKLLSSLSGGLKGEAEKELKRRLTVEKNIRGWEQQLLDDYGAVLEKSSKKGIKARQILRTLQHAGKLAAEGRERMEVIAGEIE
ncbi:MAG: alkaline phosphatase family protein [Deltaproteobacteria bacterium]|nr:alkaline phosphatase family protein [Deltaproteobacteria bacterium]